MDNCVPTAFGGYDDLLVFLDRVTVWSQLKGFSGEKKALALASRLEGAAFDSYRRLSVDDKTSFDVIVSSLKREFLRCGADRMQAVTDLRRRKWAVTAESVGAFGHDVQRLARLSYPSFDVDSVTTVARDAFLEGLPHEFQVQLRLSGDTALKSVAELSEEAHRLQIAGIGERKPSGTMPALSRDFSQSSGSSHLSTDEDTRCHNCRSLTFDRSADADGVGHVSAVDSASGSRQKSVWGRGRGRRRKDFGMQKTSGRLCFICGDPNHIRPNYPHLHDCHRCLRPGHVARNCTAQAPVHRGSGKESHVTSLTTNVHGFIMVTAIIGKEKCPFLVDTGADVSLIDYDVVEGNKSAMTRRVARQPVMVEEGSAKGMEHTIPLTDDASVTCRPRRLPTKWRAEVAEEVRNLHQRGVIRPSTSAFAAPVCPVKKMELYVCALIIEL